MCDVLKELLSFFEPYFSNLDDIKQELDQLSDKSIDVDGAISFSHDNHNNLIKFLNQELVITLVGKTGSTKSEYEAMSYMLNLKDDYVLLLPQYKKSLVYFDQLYNFIVAYGEAMHLRIGVLKSEYFQKSLLCKYDKILKTNPLYVDDPNEFKEYLSYSNLRDIEKVAIYQYIIKENVDYYHKSISKTKDGLNKLEDNQDLVKLHAFMHDNGYLLQKENILVYQKVSEDVNLSNELKEIITEKLLEKLDIMEIIMAKEVWLMRKITNNYKLCEFGRVSKYYKEYEYITKIKNKLKGISKYEDIMRILEEEL